MILAFLLDVAISLAGAAIHPTAAHCPRGSWLSHGVRNDGRFTCTFDAHADEGDAPAPLRTWRPSIDGRVWCSSGSPRQDGARVWCAGEEPRS